MVELWVPLGMIAAVFWGIYIVLLKLVADPRYMGTSLPNSTLGLGVGVIIGAAVFFLVQGQLIQGFSFKNIGMGFLVAVVAGLLWIAGAIAVLMGLTLPATDTSRMVVLYNLNTLVAVAVAILVLGEIPSAQNRIEVLIGAMLIMAGAFLVTRS